MKKYFYLAFCLYSFHIYAQIETKAINPFNIGECRTIHSTILAEDRLLNIYLPNGYQKDSIYPVIYLLDGSIDEDILHIAGLVQFYKLQFQMPDFIVIGIENVDRKRDFTFPTAIEELKTDYPTTGGSAHFIRFLEEELQPYIKKSYKVNEISFLIGQSLGGLLAIEILLKKPTLFSHYLIVSPSLWWDDQSLLHEAGSLLEKHQKYLDRYVYLSVGSLEHPTMVKDAKSLNEILQMQIKYELKCDFLEMTKENHATILHQSISEAFKLLYPYKD